MIYLDTSALVKLLVAEDCSEDLRAYLNDHRTAPLVSSALVEVELPRALRRAAPEALPFVPDILGRLYRLETDAIVRSIAGACPDAHLRALDAIHLAAVRRLVAEGGGELEAFVAYDDRLLREAIRADLPVRCPGRRLPNASD